MFSIRDVEVMAIEDAIEFLKNTDKPIFYKKGRYGKKVPVKDKNEAVELYENCEDGAIMVCDDHIEIGDYDEIDWLS